MTTEVRMLKIRTKKQKNERGKYGTQKSQKSLKISKSRIRCGI